MCMVCVDLYVSILQLPRFPEEVSAALDEQSSNEGSDTDGRKVRRSSQQDGIWSVVLWEFVCVCVRKFFAGRV